MVFTRYQAALAQFLAQGNNPLSDEEVSVGHRIDSAHSAPGSEDQDLSVTVSDLDMAGQSDRLEAVESAVKDINHKFDSLLAAVTATAPGAHTVPTPGLSAPHTPRAAAMLNTPAGGRPAGPTPPVRTPMNGMPPLPPGFPQPAGLVGPGYDEYVLEQLRREEFFAPRTDDGKGFYNDFFNKTLSPKPFMYLKRQGVNTLKKKLEVRETMSFNEYILAYFKMIRDPRANQSHLIYYHVEHMQQLAEDALHRDWATARAWSQNTLAR